MLKLLIYNRKRNLSLLFLGICSLANALNTGKIEGRLLSSASNKPIEYATISLHSLPDSALVTGVSTDTTGLFTFNDLPFGNYVLKCSSIGYKRTIKEGVILSSSNPLVHIDKITMDEETKSLAEVTIIGERLKGVAEVDKTVYTVSEKAAATANSGLELLRQVPAVSVDFQKNVLLEGSSNIQILVDDRVRDKNYLAQIDPKTIDKIEIMTNPSVKYGADVTGVINIKLKKDRKGGFAGGFSAEVPINFNVISSGSRANIEYGTSKIRLYASANAYPEKLTFKSSTYRKSTEGNTVTEFIQKGTNIETGMWSNLEFGIDWFVNDKNTVNFYASFNPKNKFENKADSITKEWLTDGIRSKFLTNSPSNQINSGNDRYYGVFYKRNFAKPEQELTIDANYCFSDILSDNQYNVQNYLMDKLTKFGDVEYHRETTDTYAEGLVVKADYMQPIFKKIKLGLGYQNITTRYKSKFYLSSDAFANTFQHNQFLNSVYANISGSIKNFSWQGGLRLESAKVEIGTFSPIDYLCLLPQVSVQQKINDKQSIKLSYRRSIQRPSIQNLNPIVLHSGDSLNTSSGNPNLKPSYYNKVELAYPIQLGSNYLSPSAYVNYFNDGFESVTVVTGNKSKTRVENVGTGFEYGLSLSGAVNVAKWWTINPYISVFKMDITQIEQYNIEGASKVSYRTNLYNVFSLPKSFTVFNFFSYSSPYITSQSTNKRGVIFGFGVEKQLLKNKNGKISILTINPFLTTFDANNSEINRKNYFETSKMSIDIANFWTVTFSFTFQQRADKIKKLNREQNEPKGGGKVMF